MRGALIKAFVILAAAISLLILTGWSLGLAVIYATMTKMPRHEQCATYSLARFVVIEYSQNS